MKYIYLEIRGDVVFAEEREYFSDGDAMWFCGTHHTLPYPIGAYMDDGFGLPVKTPGIPYGMFDDLH